MKIRFPLRLKIFSVIVILVLGALTAFYYVANQTIRDETSALVFNFDSSYVESVAHELELHLQGMTLDLSMIATISNIPGAEYMTQNVLQHSFAQYGFYNISVYAKGASGWVNIKYFNNGLEVAKAFSPDRLPLDEIVNAKLRIWNTSTETQRDSVAIACAVQIKDQAGNVLPAVAVAQTPKAALMDVPENPLREIFVLSPDGQLIYQLKNDPLETSSELREIPLVGEYFDAIQKQSPLRNRVMEYKLGDSEFVGAYSRTTTGQLGVFSVVAKQAAFKVLQKLRDRTLLLSSVLFCLVVIISILFSASITKPLSLLMVSMKKVTEGKHEEFRAPHTGDEVEVLSSIYNKMIAQIKTTMSVLEQLNQNLEAKVQDRTKELAEMAIRDPMTGAYNRRHFVDELKKALDESKAKSIPTSLLYCDIDHFKNYNDKNGHPEGDELIKSFTKMLQKHGAAPLTVARLGGEEFGVICPGSSLEAAAQLAEKIRQEMASTNWPYGERQPLGRVTCSIGVSEYPRCSDNYETLIKTADAALYVAKTGGRNAVRTADVIQISINAA